jgi:hypothetical protein
VVNVSDQRPRDSSGERGESSIPQQGAPIGNQDFGRARDIALGLPEHVLNVALIDCLKRWRSGKKSGFLRRVPI